MKTDGAFEAEMIITQSYKHMQVRGATSVADGLCRIGPELERLMSPYLSQASPPPSDGR